jgi:hypothetical protein
MHLLRRRSFEGKVSFREYQALRFRELTSKFRGKVATEGCRSRGISHGLEGHSYSLGICGDWS